MIDIPSTSGQIVRSGQRTRRRKQPSWPTDGSSFRVASTRSLTAALGSLAPNVLARCVTEDLGTLSIAEPSTVEHRRAIVVKDAGNVPGSSPRHAGDSRFRHALPTRNHRHRRPAGRRTHRRLQSGQGHHCNRDAHSWTVGSCATDHGADRPSKSRPVPHRLAARVCWVTPVTRPAPCERCCSHEFQQSQETPRKRISA
jgi:hypothetical protein